MNSSPPLFGLHFTRKKSKVVLLPVPWDVTTSYNDGTSLGPRHILNESPQIDLYDIEFKEIYKKGIYMEPISQSIFSKNKTLRKISKKLIQNFNESELKNKKTKLLTKEKKKVFLKKINSESENMVHWVYKKTKAILKEKKIPGLIGGEHSISLGAIKAVSQAYPKYGLLHIDAHLDLRKNYQGFLHSHASIMNNIFKLTHPPHKTISVGIRDLCKEEWDRLKENKNHICFNDYQLKNLKFNGISWNAVCKKIISKLPKYLYITLDVDGMTPENFPHTGTPVPGGLEYDEFLYLLSKIVQSKRKIIGFDLCEIAPGLHGNWDGNAGMRLLYKLCGWALMSHE